VKLDLVLIRVNDFPRMLAFYRDVLGFAPVEEQPDAAIYQPGVNWVALETGGMRLELFARRTPQPRTMASPPPVVPALRVTRLEEAVVRLKAAGVQFVREGSQAWGSYADFLDPEGNELNLYEDTRRA
jgi:catechol 2,3-dioxygenase-like lactoylglutathione lyase family enzyme